MTESIGKSWLSAKSWKARLIERELNETMLYMIDVRFFSTQLQHNDVELQPI